MRLFVIASLACGIGAAGCSAKHDPPPGAIMIAVDTNLKVPDDIDEIGISVTTSSGGVTEDQTWRIAPAGDARFPATLAVLRGTALPIDIRAVGYKGGTALALREAVTTIPSDRTALLRLDLNWLDKGSVMGTNAEQVHTLDSLGCAMGETSVAGACTKFTLESAMLDTFSTVAVPASDDSSACVDVDSCLASGGGGTVSYPLPLSSSDCSVAAPASTATGLNVGLRLLPGGDGWCDATGCTIPLAMDATEGWTIGADARVHLPAAVCTNPKVVAVTVAGASTDCPTQTTKHPACQTYGADGGTEPVSDGGLPDATMADGGPADASGASDGEPPDSAAAPVTYVYPSPTGILAFAVDLQYIYVLEKNKARSGPTLTLFDRTVADLSARHSTTITIDGTATTPTYAMAASYPGLAILATDNLPSGTGALNVFWIGDPTLATPPTLALDHAQADSPSFTIGTGVNATNPRLVVANLGMSSVLAEVDMQTGTYNSDGQTGGAVGYDRTSGSYALYYGSMNNTYGPYPASGVAPSGLYANPALTFAGNPVAFAFPGDDIVAWVGDDDTIYVTRAPGTATPHVVASAPASAEPSRVISGIASGRLVWIDATGQLRETAVPVDGGTLPTTFSPVLLDAGTDASAAATQVVLDGNDLYWTDGTNLWHSDVRTIPGVD